MELRFAPNGHLEIDDARLIFKNFSGVGTKYNREGARNFAVVIPTEEMADALVADKNKFGIGWNVTVKDSPNAGDPPYMHLKVKIGRNAVVWLITGDKRRQLKGDELGRLDRIRMANVDLDIRPYDDEGVSGPFRAAYLYAMEVTQDLDRFTARNADDFDDEDDYMEE